MIIAIDGVAASGKGTLAELLANWYRCAFLPTGNLYRVIAKKLLERGEDLDNPTSSLSIKNLVNELKDADILDKNLGSDTISQAASKIAKVSVVRQALTEFQQDWINDKIKKVALKDDGYRKMAIVEGRDIGTVVWPEAEVKLFLVADLEARTKRRTEQLHKEGAVFEKEIYDHLAERDRQDREREIAPMKMAKDAILLDTTNLTIKEMQQRAVALIEKKIDNSPGKV